MGGRVIYPDVLGEMETLDLVLSGRSLARYGDGEFKMARSPGIGIKSQQADTLLSRRLAAILRESGDCLVGIPNIRSQTPKAEFWGRVAPWATSLLSDRRLYVSSFISRADSAPWINTEEYWSKVEQLWRGRDVTLVRGSGKAFTPERMPGAGRITEIMAPKMNAWSEYQSLLDRIGTPDRVLISLGPTATVMAVDLCARGVHAIDVGHMGSFMRKWNREPEPEVAA